MAVAAISAASVAKAPTELAVAGWLVALIILLPPGREAVVLIVGLVWALCGGIGRADALGVILGVIGGGGVTAAATTAAVVLAADVTAAAFTVAAGLLLAAAFALTVLPSRGLPAASRPAATPTLADEHKLNMLM